jgi:hypothetical protein
VHHGVNVLDYEFAAVCTAQHSACELIWKYVSLCWCNKKKSLVPMELDTIPVKLTYAVTVTVLDFLQFILAGVCTEHRESTSSCSAFA